MAVKVKSNFWMENFRAEILVLPHAEISPLEKFPDKPLMVGGGAEDTARPPYSSYSVSSAGSYYHCSVYIINLIFIKSI